MKGALKAMRASQPFNWLATSATRSVLSLTGRRSEWVVKHLHRVGTIKARLPNGRILRLWSRGDDWVSNRVYWRGWDGYEPESVRLFYRLAEHARVTLDVGAYVGFYTLLAAHANPEGRVFAFEPMPGIQARLRRHVELNRLGNAECVAAAVGDVDGTAEFFHVPADLPTSSSLSFEFMGSHGGLVSFKTPVLKLDTFVRDRNLDRVDLLKIDTESTEPQVLRGMAETLRRDRPTMLCEVLKGRGSEDELERILRPLGYQFYLLTPTGPALQEHVVGHPEWLNYLFTTLSADEVAGLRS